VSANIEKKGQCKNGEIGSIGDFSSGTFEGALGIEGAQALAGLMQSIQAGTETVPKTRAALLKRLGLS
jgi:hypothetical protein